MKGMDMLGVVKQGGTERPMLVNVSDADLNDEDPGIKEGAL